SFAAEKPLQLVKYLLRRRGMLTSNVGEAYGFVRSRPDLQHPDLELILAPAPFFDEGLGDPYGHAVVTGPILLTPRSRGAITLATPAKKPWKRHSTPARIPCITPSAPAEWEPTSRALSTRSYMSAASKACGGRRIGDAGDHPPKHSCAGRADRGEGGRPDQRLRGAGLGGSRGGGVGRDPTGGGQNGRR
ncbi:MAG: choline dehydrogenase, partial [Mycobacterium sp.]|nr:choline dehydrogenase [Mycobacterium sp.]